MTRGCGAAGRQDNPHPLVLRLGRADTGSVRFDGVDLATLPASGLRLVRRRMHVVLQDPHQSLHPGMRVVRLVASHSPSRVCPASNAGRSCPRRA